MTDWAAEKYVSLRTFKRDGSEVDTPVWVVGLGQGRLGFTTDPDSWKVKRIRRNAQVELRPCSARGRVAPGAPVLLGQAIVATTDADVAPVSKAIRSKYKVLGAIMGVGSALAGMVGKRPDTCAVIVTPSD